MKIQFKRVMLGLLIISGGLIYACASKPSDDKCIAHGKLFMTKYLNGHTNPTITVRDHFFYKAISYSNNKVATVIGHGYLGNIRLSYSIRE